MIVDGIKLNDKDSLKYQVVANLNKATGLHLHVGEVEEVFVHEVNESDEETPTLQAIFKELNTKKNILRKKASLKPTKIFVKENLTPRQSAIFFQARLAKKNKLIANTWTGDGLVYGCHKDDSPGVCISNLDLITKANEEHAAMMANKTNDEGHIEGPGESMDTTEIEEPTINDLPPSFLNKSTLNRKHTVARRRLGNRQREMEQGEARTADNSGTEPCAQQTARCENSSGSAPVTTGTTESKENNGTATLTLPVDKADENNDKTKSASNRGVHQQRGAKGYRWYHYANDRPLELGKRKYSENQ